MIRLRLTLIVLAFMLVPASRSLAQQARVAVQEGPYYLGEPLLIRVTAKGFEEKPQPTCEPGSIPPGLAVKMVAVRPSVSSFTEIINGRVTSYRRVSYEFDFHAVAEKPGRYTIPEFTVRQDKRVARTRGLNLRIQDIETDEDMRVALVLPSEGVYAGEHVPVTVEWWYAGSINEVRNLTIRSPIFDQFAFIDEPSAKEDTVLPIETQKGTLQLKATVEKRVLEGRAFTVLSAKRLLVADQPGEHEVAAITANIEKVTRWGYDLFGSRQPAATVRLRAIGKSLKLVIRTLPLEKAPPSFGGAVGRGFTISVKADRTVVRVGDPIKLTVTVRGDGNLEDAGLAPLSASGLDPRQFRSPGGDVAGTLSRGGKSFVLTVRVIDGSVTEIPPVAYSWFDTKRREFQTVESDPIALRVLPAQVIGAKDVVSGSSLQKKIADAEEPPPSTARSVAPGGSARRYDLTGADLAIETDPTRLLLVESERFGGPRVRSAIYISSVLLLLLGWIWRRASEVDSERLMRRKLIKRQVSQIARAQGLPCHEAASEIAAAMRRMAVQANGEMRGEIENLVAECDSLAYAPDGDKEAPIDQTLFQRALTVARAIAKETR